MAETMQTEEEVSRVIERCQAILRISMWIIPLALVFIIITTTFSTGATVRILAKAFYYLAVLSIAVPLVTWAHRTKVEKRLRPPRIL